MSILYVEYRYCVIPLHESLLARLSSYFSRNPGRPYSPSFYVQSCQFIFFCWCFWHSIKRNCWVCTRFISAPYYTAVMWHINTGIIVVVSALEPAAYRRLSGELVILASDMNSGLGLLTFISSSTTVFS